MFHIMRITISSVLILAAASLGVGHAQKPIDRTHLAYVFNDSVKYVQLNNGQITLNQVIDYSQFEKGFLNMKIDQQGNPYFAYAINRNSFNTHWFVMFAALQSVPQILPMPGYIIPLGVSLVLDQQGTNTTYYVVASVQAIDGTPLPPQRIYLFKRSSNSLTWQRATLLTNQQVNGRNLLSHLHAYLDGSGLLHIAYNLKPMTGATLVHGRELIVDLRQNSVLHNRQIDTTAVEAQTGVNDSFHPIHLEETGGEVYSSFLTANGFKIKNRLSSSFTWNDDLTIPQGVAGEMKVMHLDGTDFMALGLVENGSFPSGGSRFNFYVKTSTTSWIQYPFLQGETYFSPRISLGSSGYGPKVAVATSIIDPFGWNRLAVYFNHIVTGSWLSQIIQVNLPGNHPINNIQIIQE